MIRHPRVLLFNLIVFIASVFMLPHNALAHAVLEKSTPAANATIEIGKLNAGGFPIELVFNSRIDAAHSSLSLMDPDGKPVSLSINPGGDANILRSTVSAIKPGHYSLRWQVVANDGHISRGAIPFLAQ